MGSDRARTLMRCNGVAGTLATQVRAYHGQPPRTARGGQCVKSSKLLCGELGMAIATCQPLPGLLVHLDLGSQ